MVIKQLNALVVFFQTNVGFTHPIVSFEVGRIRAYAYFAIFNNFSIVFVLQVDACSIGMEFGFQCRGLGIEIDGLGILFIGIFHIIGIIGSLLDSSVSLFLD